MDENDSKGKLCSEVIVFCCFASNNSSRYLHSDNLQISHRTNLVNLNSSAETVEIALKTNLSSYFISIFYSISDAEQKRGQDLQVSRILFRSV